MVEYVLADGLDSGTDVCREEAGDAHKYPVRWEEWYNHLCARIERHTGVEQVSMRLWICMVVGDSGIEGFRRIERCIGGTGRSDAALRTQVNRLKVPSSCSCALPPSLARREILSGYEPRAF